MVEELAQCGICDAGQCVRCTRWLLVNGRHVPLCLECVDEWPMARQEAFDWPYCRDGGDDQGEDNARVEIYNDPRPYLDDEEGDGDSLLGNVDDGEWDDDDYSLRDLEPMIPEDEVAEALHELHPYLDDEEGDGDSLRGNVDDSEWDDDDYSLRDLEPMIPEDEVAEALHEFHPYLDDELGSVF